MIYWSRLSYQDLKRLPTEVVHVGANVGQEAATYQVPRLAKVANFSLKNSPRENC